jgi:hypothetical protein
MGAIARVKADEHLIRRRFMIYTRAAPEVSTPRI